MEVRQLEAFVKIAGTGSFTRASEALSLTQPAVTRQIGALERELGTRLFERTGKRAVLTPAGDVLLQCAQQILQQLGDAATAIRAISDGVAGPLSVGVSSTFATYVLPPLLRQYRERHPGIALSVHTGSSHTIAQMVAANAVDLGVVMDFHPQPKICQVDLTHYDYVLVLSPDLSRHAPPGAPATIADLHALLALAPLISMQPGTNLRGFVNELLAGWGQGVKVSMELDHVEAIKNMVQAGIGLAVLPGLAVQSEVGAGRLCVRDLSAAYDTRRTISAIYRDDKFQSAAWKALLNLMRESL